MILLTVWLDLSESAVFMLQWMRETFKSTPSGWWPQSFDSMAPLLVLLSKWVEVEKNLKFSMQSCNSQGHRSNYTFSYFRTSSESSPVAFLFIVFIWSIMSTLDFLHICGLLFISCELRQKLLNSWWTKAGRASFTSHIGLPVRKMFSSHLGF